MNFLPIENLIYKTKLSEEELFKRLTNIIETESEKKYRYGIFRVLSSKPYEGEIHNNSFDIRRNVGYRKAYLPRIIGHIDSDLDGININIKMRLQDLEIGFLFVWCSVFVLMFIFPLLEIIINSEFNPHFFIPFGILLALYLMIMVRFKMEILKSKKDLKVLLKAD